MTVAAPVWLWISTLLMAPAPSSAAQMKRLYVQGSTLYKQQKWRASAKAFRQLLPLFLKTQSRLKAGTQPYHLMTIGRADVLFHLAMATWYQKQRRTSCLHHKALSAAISTLPPPWRTWNVRPELPQRFQASARHLQLKCPTVPSVVLLQIQPSAADAKTTQIELRSAGGKWRAFVGRRLDTKMQAISLRVKAPGYLPALIEQRFVPRWKSTRIVIKLTPKPKARVVVIKQRTRPIPRPRPLPKASTPFYNTWWFWTITGVVVLGTATGVILYATLPRRYGFSQSPDGPGFKIAE